MSENQWDLVGKYLSGEASAKEIAEVEALMVSDEPFRRHVEESRWLWEHSDKVREAEEVDVDAAWRRVSARIDTGVDTHAPVRPVVSETRDSRPRGRTATLPAGTTSLAAAVAALVMLSAVAFFFLNRNAEDIIAQQTGPSEVIELELPDGTIVTLNENSRLSYAPDFGTDERTVTLSGEGFFDVMRDEHKPFIVHTEALEVTVLGTSFDVQAYDSESESSVVVATGRVRVEAGNEEVQLVPGDMGTVSKSNNSLTKGKTDGDVRNVSAWRMKSFTFQNEELTDVVENLSDSYHMDVSISEESLKNCRLSATFNNRTLKEVLQIISSTLNVNVEKTPRGYKLSGQGC
ncbi:MAG: FecR domain-containing protein [Cyclobacteriaceae bacterium]